MNRNRENEYITPKYETITAAEKKKLLELFNSSLIHAFSRQDYMDVIVVFRRIVDRLERGCENETTDERN